MARWVLLLFLVALLDTAAPLTVSRKISNTFQLSMASSVSSSNGIGEITKKGTNEQVFVCTNKWCKEKGGDATMATFTFLTPSNIPVLGVNCLGRCNKGPNAKILTKSGAFIEASTIRSVENVVDLLQLHLGLNVNVTSAEVLRLNYEGNVHLRDGEVDQAIDCYNRALELGDNEQEGVLLVMRGTALLQRAYAYKMRFKDMITIAEDILPNEKRLQSMLDSYNTLSTPLRYKISMELLGKVSSLYRKLDSSALWNNELKAKWPEVREGKVANTGDDLLGRCNFVWSLYEHALLKALQDLLTATVLLPGFAQAWRRAGDTLNELRYFKSSREYYEVAIRLDPNLTDLLVPTIQKLKLMEQLIANAENKGIDTDTIVSLLDD